MIQVHFSDFSGWKSWLSEQPCSTRTADHCCITRSLTFRFDFLKRVGVSVRIQQGVGI